MNKILHWIKNPLPYRLYRRSVVLVLIAITAAVFVLQQLLPPLLEELLFLNPFLILNRGYIWTLFSYMFAHASFSHILFNMLGLYFFGMPLERSWGSSEFLFLYFLCGIGAGIISLIVYVLFGAWSVFLLGASGAVFGVMLAFTCLYPNVQIYIFGIFPVTARVLMLIYIGLQLISLQGGIGSGIAYLTHLGGMAVAWAYMLLRHSINPYKRLLNKW